jgi:hypothetical protein
MSRAFVKELDTEYLEELPERPVSEHPNDVTGQAWRRSNMPWRRPAKPMPPHRHQPIARRLPLRAATFATGPPGAQRLVWCPPQSTAPKCGSARQ